MILTEKTFSKETIVVHIAKQEYHKYNIFTYILQPKLDSTMSYLLLYFYKFHSISNQL